MIRMKVRNEDVLDRLDPQLHRLERNLGAFAAVDHEAVFVVHDDGRRQAALDRRRRR